MTIGNFIELFYIKAYLKNQDRAFMNLIKGSVQYSDVLSYAEPSYHGFVHGNNIASFAAQVLDAGLSVETISKYINKTLYPTRHNGSPKAKAQYQNKTYKDALYDQVKDKFDEITPENMSDILAQTLFSIIQDAAMDKGSVKSSKPRNATSILSSYTIPAEEKTAILNLCGLINGTLQDIKHKIEAIDRKQHELRGLSEDETDQRWKAYLEFELNTIKNDLEKQYSKLKEYCSDVSKLLEQRQHLTPSIKAIYGLTSQIDNDEYKVTCPETLRYSALSSLISNYQKNYEILRACIKSL